MTKSFIKKRMPWLLFLAHFFIYSCSTKSKSADEKKNLSYSDCNFEGIETGDFILKRGLKFICLRVTLKSQITFILF
jgi:hypothetical protein